jgi:hypothetical protein
MVEMRDNGPEAKTINEKSDTGTHRSIYLPLLRGVTPRSLEAFDPVDQTLVTATRDATTVPGQALYLLNAPFVRKQSLALAERLLADAKTTDAARLASAYRLVLGRAPTAKETERAVAFLTDYEAAYRKQPLAKTETKPVKPAKPKAPAKPPLDPDQVDQTGEAVVEEVVYPKDARTAAWLAFAQALFASAEFRYVR